MSAPEGADGLPTDAEGVRSPSTAAVLGPLPIWAVAVLTGAWLGEVLGSRWPGAVVVATVASVVAVGALGVLLRSGLRHEAATWSAPLPANRSGLAVGMAAVLAVLSVGIAASAARLATTELGALPALAATGGRAVLEVTVVHEPRPVSGGWQVLYRVEVVAGQPTRERVAALHPEDPPVLGSRWRLEATARPLPDSGYGRWLARQHATVAIDVVQREPLAAPGRLVSASEYVRARVREAAGRHQADRLAGLLAGFVTGDTRSLPEADVAAMRATSLTHLTAVSGTNVAILTAGVLALAVLLRLPATARRRLVVVTVLWFAFVTRFQPSVLRAGTMALLVLLAASRGLPRDARHALAGAVLLLVLVDPALAGSLGLLLSATATAGVLVAAPRIRVRLAGVPRRLAELLAISLGAQVAVVPLLLTTFGEVPLAAIPANVVAVPAAMLAAATGFLATVVALVHLEAGAWLFALAGVPARLVLGAAHTFAGLGGPVHLGNPAAVVALLLGAGWLLSRGGSRPARHLAAAMAIALLAAAVPPVWGAVPPRTLTLTAIDVGQGDAFLVESPGARILVDAGTDDTAARWLRTNGRRRLDLVVVTHPHLDHIGGVPDVLASLRVGAVWFRPVPTALPHPELVLARAAEAGIPVRAPVAGDRAVVGDLEIEVLGPPPGRPYRTSRSELNDTSVVLRVTHAGRRLLLTGDSEVAAHADLLERPELLVAEAMTVPHHGGATTDPALFPAVRPQIAVVSAGAGNRHGHPAPATLAALADLDVEVRRTDQEGTVRIEVPAPRALPAVPAVPRDRHGRRPGRERRGSALESGVTGRGVTRGPRRSSGQGVGWSRPRCPAPSTRPLPRRSLRSCGAHPRRALRRSRCRAAPPGPAARHPSTPGCRRGPARRCGTPRR